MARNSGGGNSFVSAVIGVALAALVVFVIGPALGWW